MDLESISVGLLKLSFHLRSMAFSLNGVQLKEPERIGMKVSQIIQGVTKKWQLIYKVLRDTL